MRKKKSKVSHKVQLGAWAIAGALVLSGCQTKDEKIDPIAGGGGLTGKWVSSDNVFSAQLDNGLFFSTANDTGEVLSEGTYIVISAKEIQMKWRGKLSQQENSANCQREGVGVLICTDLVGKGFTLRKAGISS
jgi:hypothetical protein